MTSPTPYATPYPYPYPPAFGAPPRPRSPGLVSAARILAGVQAGIGAFFALLTTVLFLPWALALQQEHHNLHTESPESTHALVVTWVVIGLGALAGVGVGVPALCLRPGGRRTYAVLLVAEVVTAAAGIAFAVGLHSRGLGVAAGLFSVCAACVVAFLCSPDVRRWASA